MTGVRDDNVDGEFKIWVGEGCVSTFPIWEDWYQYWKQDILQYSELKNLPAPTAIKFESNDFVLSKAYHDLEAIYYKFDTICPVNECVTSVSARA